MDTPTTAEFAEEPRALDKAYDDYILEVGVEAVAAQFGVGADFVIARKLKPEIAFFLFDRQADLHKAALEAAGVLVDSFGNTQPVAQPEEGLPGLPRMLPMTQRDGNWIDPVPRRRRDQGAHNSPVI